MYRLKSLKICVGMGWDGNLCKHLFYEHRSVVLIKIEEMCIEVHLKIPPITFTKHKPIDQQVCSTFLTSRDVVKLILKSIHSSHI